MSKWDDGEKLLNNLLGSRDERMTNMRCFVAMAFGREDCDQLYRKQVKPVLKALQLIPVRVDQRQHKDDLNTFIIRMLNKSQIALVDLTYARPSVYYEAGYAERVIPVAYTSRKDHLSRAQPDDRLRVHFDLEMKKIVDWTDPSDRTFPRRLRARLRYLLGPLIEQSMNRAKIDLAREQFESIALSERLETIRTRATHVLRRHRYWTAALSDLMPRAVFDLTIRHANIGAKMIGRTCEIAVVLAEDTYSSRQLRDAIYRIARRIPVQSTGIGKIQINCFLFSLKPMNAKRLMKALPHAHRISERQFRLASFDVHSIDGLCTIHLFPSVACPADIADGLSNMRSVLPKKKSNRTTILVESEDHWRRLQIQFTRKMEPNHRLHSYSEPASRLPRR